MRTGKSTQYSRRTSTSSWASVAAKSVEQPNNQTSQYPCPPWRQRNQPVVIMTKRWADRSSQSTATVLTQTGTQTDVSSRVDRSTQTIQAKQENKTSQTTVAPIMPAQPPAPTRVPNVSSDAPSNVRSNTLSNVQSNTPSNVQSNIQSNTPSNGRAYTLVSRPMPSLTRQTSIESLVQKWKIDAAGANGLVREGAIISHEYKKPMGIVHSRSIVVKRTPDMIYLVPIVSMPLGNIASHVAAIYKKYPIYGGAEYLELIMCLSVLAGAEPFACGPVFRVRLSNFESLHFDSFRQLLDISCLKPTIENILAHADRTPISLIGR